MAKLLWFTLAFLAFMCIFRPTGYVGGMLQLVVYSIEQIKGSIWVMQIKQGLQAQTVREWDSACTLFQNDSQDTKLHE